MAAARKVSLLFGGLTLLAPCVVCSIVPGSCLINHAAAACAAPWAAAAIASAEERDVNIGGAITSSPTYGTGGGGITPEVIDSKAGVSGSVPGLQLWRRKIHSAHAGLLYVPQRKGVYFPQPSTHNRRSEHESGGPGCLLSRVGNGRGAGWISGIENMSCVLM